MANDSSPWHWMLLSTSLGVQTRGGASARDISQHISQTWKEIVNTHLTWLKHSGKHLRFSFFFFFPFCGILVPLRKSLVAKWRFMTWKMGKKDKPRLQHWHKSTTGLKYFTPQGLFSPDVLTHLNKGTSGAAAAWLWLKDQRVDWPRACLFGSAQTCSLFAQQAFSALWENSHMAIFPARWRRNATMSVRSLRSRLTQAALSTAPLCLSV